MTRHIHPNSTGSRLRAACRLAVPVIALSAAALVTTSQPASAGIVPTVALGTSASYSVLAGVTITNTGPSVLDKSAGLAPGSAVDGFPPGTVLAPGTIEAANAVSLQAKNDLTTAYLDAAGRPVEFTQTNPDLVGLTLVPGVYAATAKAPLSLSGQLTLDGQNNPLAVFIFQTDSTLITASASQILLINGASECNVFWQVGSSATLGTGSTFVGNILALTSIAAQTGANIQGRTLARNGEVTLDTNVFTSTACALGPAPAAPPATTVPAAAPTVPPVATVATVPGIVDTDITLPRTGRSNVGSTTAIGSAVLASGAIALMLARRRRPVV
jgi:LPXTG-motif cell wall-anchored protein